MLKIKLITKHFGTIKYLISQPVQHNNAGSTNDLNVGRSYLFNQPMAGWGSVMIKKKNIPFLPFALAQLVTKITHSTLKLIITEKIYMFVVY